MSRPKFGLAEVKQILLTENKKDLSYYKDAISKCCFLDRQVFEQVSQVIDLDLDWIAQMACDHVAKQDAFLSTFKWFYSNYKSHFSTEMLEDAMISASISGNINVVKYCLEELKLNVHVDLDAPLRQAARFGKFEIVRYLVENHQPHLTAYKSYALNFAIRNGHTDIVKYLRSFGCKPRDDFCLVGWCFCNPYGDRKGAYFCSCSGTTTWKDVK